MKPKGLIRTSDNVFDFGRGGRANLTCVYNFLLGKYEGLRLTVRNASFGDRPCATGTDPETGRYFCNYAGVNVTGESGSGKILRVSNFFRRLSPGNFHLFSPAGLHPRAQLSLEEYIWPGENISAHSHCICSNSSAGPGFTFLGRKVTLTFRVEGMSGRDSFENFFAHLEYETVPEKGCRRDNHHQGGTESGLISLESTYIHGGTRAPSCESYPWLLEAKENHSLYLRIPG